MFAELIESVRELRSPLVIGYGILFTIWLWFAEGLDQALSTSDLGQRLRDGFSDLGSASTLALITFAAGMIGSLVWRLFFEDLIVLLQRLFKHPNWDDLTSRAIRTVKEYEEYSVVTVAQDEGSSQEMHRVPSPHYGAVLMRKADDREKQASEVVFRMSLAIALLPGAISLWLIGSGWWWLSALAAIVPWLHVSLIKRSTALEVLDFNISNGVDELEIAMREFLTTSKKDTEAYREASDRLLCMRERVERLVLQRRRRSSPLLLRGPAEIQLPPEVERALAVSRVWLGRMSA